MARTKSLTWWFCFVAVLCLHGPVLAAKQQKNIDLNGDGKLDAIVLHADDEGGYALTVNGITVKHWLDGGVNLSIIDLDSRDKWKEVMIDTMGPSDDPACRIYAYDGKKLFAVAMLEGFRTLSGVGYLYTRDWMGFWDRTDKHALNQKTHKLELVPQEFHYVAFERNGKVQCVEAVVKTGFAIYATRGGDQAPALATLSPKSAI